MREMVYDDTRWVQRLQIMGCWNEAEARKRFEEARYKKWEAQKARHVEEAKRVGIGVDGGNGTHGGVEEPRRTSVTLFDAGWEEEEERTSMDAKPKQQQGNIVDGFDAIALSPSGQLTDVAYQRPRDPESLLNILASVRSTRGHARQEYGKIYGALAPFYFDIVQSKKNTDPVVFRSYRDPGHQARMLAQLKTFAKSDTSQGWLSREEKLDGLIGVFDNAVLREFEYGFQAGDVEGRMRKYAHVLVTLNGGQAGIDLFIRQNNIFLGKERLGNPMECINEASAGNIWLEPSHVFLDRLSAAFNEQVVIIDRVFPPAANVLLPFLDRIGDVISDYVTLLFDETHQRSIESYLKAVSGIYEQSLHFAKSLQPTSTSGDDFYEAVDSIITKIFEPHIDLYLGEELDFFKRRSDAEVTEWKRKLTEQDASMESLFMANVNRQADKRDFLTSFKRVVMMPVNVLPTFPISSPFGFSKPATAKALVNGDMLGPSHAALSEAPTRPSTSGPVSGLIRTPSRSSTPLPEAPTTELAAKAAIMNSRLEGIRSLFSIEVALNLVHAAKLSLERAARFVKLGCSIGERAREQCETIFVILLHTLGPKHVKAGFDTAVDHLSKYNPREVSEHSQTGVAPLITFLELVNVGDLIQQMIDVFYEQELVATKLTDRNDFLDPAVKEKKRFEQMLDERVAAGLNKGIDVLMDEVDFICATTQATTDFNQGASGDANNRVIDIGPSKTALQVVEVVSSHTKMLVGSTEKNMLDVFNQEVGLRLFTTLCKHLKRQRISVDGSIKLIRYVFRFKIVYEMKLITMSSDMNHYFAYIQTLKNQNLLEYFIALRELSQIYLVAPSHAKELATIIADGDRFHGIFRADEVYEFAQRRADWYQVRRSVERALYGIGCVVM